MKRKSARIIDTILVLLILIFCALVLNRAFGLFSSGKDTGSSSETAAKVAEPGAAGEVLRLIRRMRLMSTATMAGRSVRCRALNLRR